MLRGKKFKNGLIFLLTSMMTLSPLTVLADDDDGPIYVSEGVIKGKVFIKGSDSIKPSITHESIKIVYSGIDIPVNAVIKDNISVLKAEVLVMDEKTSKWVASPLMKVSGEHTGGKFLGSIPWMYVNTPKFQYKIKAYDFIGNTVETEVYEVKVKQPVKPDEYSTDFSKEPEGWILQGDWQWGQPTSGPKNYENNKLVATNISGNYSDNTESTMVLPPIDLSSSKEATVRLKHWYNTEKYDPAIVAVSNDFGQTWNSIYKFSYDGGDWKNMIVDLKPYCGSKNPVLVAFKLTSDTVTNFEGWYIDDVRILGKDLEVPKAPSELKVEVQTNNVNLNWNGVQEEDFSGYHIYRLENSKTMELVGDTKETTFVDTKIEASKNYTYIVKAYDLAGNESAESNSVSVTTLNMKKLYFNDFEAANDGWTSGGKYNTWECGEPTYYHGPEKAYSGKNVWATDLIRQYNIDSNCYLESPEFDLTKLSKAELNYKQWFWTETNCDFGHLEISVVGSNKWDRLATYTGEQKEWKETPVTLDKYVGKKVKVRFLLTSDDLGNRPGWHVDDVTLYGEEKQATNNASKHSKNDTNIQDIKNGKVPVKAEVNLNLHKDPKSYTVNAEDSDTAMLPANATVTVVETGKSAEVNRVDGTYELKHEASMGTPLTLKVESYGYYTEEEKVNLQDGGEVVKDYVLKEIPKGKLVGKIIDDRTGNPVEGAKVKVIQDERLPIVTTNSNGEYTIDNVLEGKYTAMVSHDKYHTKQEILQVDGNKDNNLSLKLKLYVGHKEEIAYDDGTSDEQRALIEGGNAWAVRITPKKYGIVEGVNFFLYRDDILGDGKNKISVIIFDSAKDGSAGEKVISTEPVYATRGQWNYIDLSTYDFKTDRDYYAAIVQYDDETKFPGIGFDKEKTFVARSYQYFPKEEHVKFRKLEFEYGNAMIRSSMAYLLEVPTLKNAELKEYTNKETIKLSGTVTIDSEVRIYDNGKAVTNTKTEGNKYIVDVPMQEGENVISAVGIYAGVETEKSDSVKIIKDTEAPKLQIISPKSGMNTNKEVVNVSGVVTDKYLSTLKINGKNVMPLEKGEFSKEIILENGINIIIVEAEDLAGNITTERLVVNTNSFAPIIKDLKPDVDVNIKAGDEIKVSFNSNAIGGKATFKIINPNYVAANAEKDSYVNMLEVKPGYYEGIWKLKSGFSFKGAYVEVEFFDALGNRTVEIAKGKIQGGNDIVTPEPNGKYPIGISELNISKDIGGVLIETSISNVSSNIQNSLLIISIIDLHGKVVNVSSMKIPNFLMGRTIKVSSTFGNLKKETYTVKAFVCEDFYNMIPISEIQEKTF